MVNGIPQGPRWPRSEEWRKVTQGTLFQRPGAAVAKILQLTKYLPHLEGVSIHHSTEFARPEECLMGTQAPWSRLTHVKHDWPDFWNRVDQRLQNHWSQLTRSDEEPIKGVSGVAHLY